MNELTDREKFIQHYVTLTTLRLMCKRMAESKLRDEDLLEVGNVDPRKDMELIRKTRCRKLSEEEVADLMEALSNEALLGGSVLNDMLE